MATRQRIGFLNSLLSLGEFAHAGYVWLIGPALAVGGPLYLMWGTVVSAAEAHGWWVYPFVTLSAAFAIFGFWHFVLHLNGRIRLLTNLDNLREEERASVKGLADKAISLSKELYSLLAEHQSYPPTLPEFDGPAGTEKWRNSNISIQRNLFRKYNEKYAAQVMGIIMMSRRYIPAEETRSMVWRLQHMSGYEIGEIAQTMVDIGVRLHESLRIPENATLPALPPSRREGELDI